MTQRLVHAERIERLTAELAAQRARAGIAFPGADLHYLLGAPLHSHERLTALVLPTAPQAHPLIVAPQLEATAEMRTRAARAGVTVATWLDGENAAERVYRQLGDGTGAVLVSADAPARHVVALQELCGEPVGLLAPLVDQLRAIKSTAEIAELARAGAAIDAVHARMGEFLHVGRTEREVAAAIERAIVDEGMTHAEFIIVGSGPHGADPHHEVSDRVIEHGDIVVVDIGGPVPAGYHSDSTRTYAMGEPRKEIAADYATLEAAQAAARAAVRPGALAADVDRAAREVLTAAGRGDLFTHRTGHGIGLSVHEAPSISPDSDTVLAAGMAFSVEPGIYHAGQWGARLEDIVVVTAEGCRSLNHRPRGLTVL